MDKGGFVYIVSIGYDSFYKIGKTRDMIRRMKELQAGNPRLHKIHSRWVPNCARTEAELHKRYKKNCANREIFHLSKTELTDIITYLDNLAHKANEKRARRKGVFEADKKVDWKKEYSQ